MSERSKKAEVRNPMLRLPAAQKMRRLPRPARELQAELLRELAKDARARAQQSWNKHKGPMAVYWRTVAVYARHTAIAIMK